MNKYQEAYKIIFDDLIPMPKLNERNRDWLYFQMDVIKEACDKANKYDELKRTLEFSEIYSTKEFYDEYKSCLENDGFAVFVMKDLTINNDFETCWKMLKNCVNKRGEFCGWKSEIAFVVWFNR